MTIFTIKFDIPDINIRLHIPGHDDDRVLQSIEALRSLIMTSKDDFIAQINALKTQLDDAAATNAKAQAEITAAVSANTANVATLNQTIADLQAVIAAGGTDIPPDVTEALAAAKTAADAVTASSRALDDLNPDAP